MEATFPPNTWNSWRSSASPGLTHSHRTIPSTMQSTWDQAARYHLDGSTTSWKSSFKCSKHTTELTLRMGSSCGHHHRQQHQSCSHRRRTGAYGCVLTTGLSIRQLSRTGTPCLSFRKCLTDCVELGFSPNWTSGTRTISFGSNRAMNIKLASELGTVSSNTELCPSA